MIENHCARDTYRCYGTDHTERHKSDGRVVGSRKETTEVLQLQPEFQKEPAK